MSPREPENDNLAAFPSDNALESLDEKSIKEERSTRLTWGTVQIREYNRIVGDNPETIVGPPLTLGWEYNEHEPVPISDYENYRPKRKVFWRLRLSSVTRKNLLKNEFGFSDEEIVASEKEIQVIRRQREATNKQGKLSASVETALQSAKRKIKRRFSRENVIMGLAAASGSFLSIQRAY